MQSLHPIAVAIVSSSPRERSELTVRLSHFTLCESSLFEVGQYESHAALLASVNRPDLIFLSLSGASGDDAAPDDRLAPARALRKRSPETPIVLLSDTVDDALGGYGVPVQGFLPPAADATHFNRTMKTCLSQIRRGDGCSILLTSGVMVRKVRTDELIYIESDRNRMLIHTRDEQIAVKTSLLALEQALPPMGFLRIGKSHVINLRRIAEVDDHQVTMLGGHVLPISRARRPVFTQALHDLHGAS